jgi:hypothetical protein
MGWIALTIHPMGKPDLTVHRSVEKSTSTQSYTRRGAPFSQGVESLLDDLARSPSSFHRRCHAKDTTPAPFPLLATNSRLQLNAASHPTRESIIPSP